MRLQTLFGIVLLLASCHICLSASAQAAASSEVGLRIIVVDKESDAQSVLQQLKQGADFADLARKVSTDITAPDGGYMGVVAPGELRPELRDALRGVSAGQLTGVIHLPTGWAVVKVLPSNERPPVKSSAAAPTPAVNATGAIRYPPNAGGKAEADLAFRSITKPDGWQQDLKAMCKLRQDSMAAVTDQVLRLLDPSSQDGVLNKAPLDEIQMRYALANVYAYQGMMEKAVQEWEAAYKRASAELPQAMPELEEVLGIAYLHKSEMDNDIYRHPGDRDLWPPVGSVAYNKTQGSEKAVAYLEKYLARHPEALDARWLLNIAYATLGKYPSGVPAQFLIPPDVFKTNDEVPRFKDIAPKVGINEYNMSGGLIVDDFENNGLLDVVTSDFGQCAPMHYFHNNGDGTFTDRTKEAGLSDQLGGLNLIQADYNNDGCVDILVLRGAWEFPQRSSLLRNNCNGTFTDVTAAAGLAVPAMQTQTAVWADIDNDGLLDLFIGNENAPSHLYRNRGDGTFEDISKKAGVDRTAYTKAVVAADYDNDGFVDFYISNLDGNNFLYHNNHDGTFSEVAEKAGVQRPRQSFAAWFFDYNNDGFPDLFVTSYYVSVDEAVRSYLKLPPNAETLKLYKNMGNGTFKDVTADVGLDHVTMPMGSNFGDIDNDGYLDIYLGTGNPVYASLLPNMLFHNKGGERFVDVTAATGTGELHKGHAVAFADVARNGNEDLLEEVGGAVMGDAHAFRFFENPGTGNNCINLKLIGKKTNRSALGARIKVTVEESGHTRSIYRTVSSGGSFGASPLEQHIGIGKASRINEIEIWWPTSGQRQRFANVAANQFLEVKESASEFRRLDYHAVKLGGVK